MGNDGIRKEEKAGKAKDGRAQLKKDNAELHVSNQSDGERR